MARSSDSPRLQPAEAQRLETLYGQYAAHLLKFFTNRTLDPEAAADLVTDTFASMADTLATRPLDEPISASTVQSFAKRELGRFLRGPANEHRPTNRYGLQVPEPLGVDLLDQVADAETRDQVADAIALLPDRQKLVIGLHDFEGLTVSEIADVLGVTPNQVGHLRGEALRALAARLLLQRDGNAAQPAILGPDGAPLRPHSPARREVQLQIAEISEELIALLADDPQLLYKLPPRRFEELVAELYRRRGFSATLTPASGDAGVDVFVARHDELGSSLSVVQCKRFAPDHKVGVGVVRELQGTLLGAGATAGVLLTTSFFTRGAKALEERFKYQLSLQDYYALQTLLRLPSMTE